LERLLKLSRQGERGFTLIEILVVVALLGILTAVVIPNVLNLMNEGEEEAKQTEWHNIQTAVLAMMVQSDVSQLDGASAYDEIQTLVQVQGVTATDTVQDPDVVYSLDEYLMGGEYPLKQAYDIALDGGVTVD